MIRHFGVPDDVLDVLVEPLTQFVRVLDKFRGRKLNFRDFDRTVPILLFGLFRNIPAHTLIDLGKIVAKVYDPGELATALAAQLK